jgi:hypothetical protein
MLYPADIECKGEIQSSPRKVKFSSSVPGNTESTWKASKKNLNDSETYTFDSVILLRALSGNDKVDATVTVRRARPKGPETVGVTIDVTA